MVKKSISFTNMDGKKVTKDCYFNLFKSELTKMYLSEEGGLDKKIQQIIDAEDTKGVIKLVEEIILASYGVKTMSDDGYEYLRKTDESREAFKSSPLYDELFMELISDPDKLNDFILGVIPQEAAAEVAKSGKVKAIASKTTKK